MTTANRSIFRNGQISGRSFGFGMFTISALLFQVALVWHAHALETPAAPTLALDPASDFGASNSDGVTNQRTPNFFITTDTPVHPGETIRLYRNDALHSAHVISESEHDAGSISMGTAGFADGTFSITASIANESGESQRSNAVSVTIDASIAAPSINLNSRFNIATDGIGTTERASPKIDVVFGLPAPRAGDVLVLMHDNVQIASKALMSHELSTASIFAPKLEVGTHSFKTYVYRPDQPRLSALSAPLQIRILPSTYVAQGVVFDGGTSLSRGTAMKGATSSKVGLFSVWFRMRGGDGVQQTFLLFANKTAPSVIIDRRPDNFLRVLVMDPRGYFAVQLISCFQINTANFAKWTHLLVSWDVANNRAQLIINRNNASCSTTVGNYAIDYAVSDIRVGGSPSGGDNLNAEVADFYFNAAESLDLSNVANIDKFNVEGKPLDIGDDGSFPTGSPPLIYLSGPTSSWQDNRGSGGGNFKSTKVMVSAASSPSN